MGEQMSEQQIGVEVVYALPERQEIFSLRLPSGATVKEAIVASRVLSRHPEIDLAKNKLGIFARLSGRTPCCMTGIGWKSTVRCSLIRRRCARDVPLKAR